MSTRLKKLSNASVLAILLSPAMSFAASSNVTVYATQDLWLAGMPSGTAAVRGYDSVPTSSPLQVEGTIYGGEIFSFSASGSTAQSGSSLAYGPDGSTSFAQHELSSSPYTTGSENGMSNIEAPYDALIGVFLSDDQPNTRSAPPMLNYNSSVSGYNASRDDTSYSPLLQQVFLVGDGKASGGIPQTFAAPAGATRLFIGTMDSYQWNNNIGLLAVTIVATDLPPPPPSLAWDASQSVVTVSWAAPADGWVLESTNVLPSEPVASWPAVTEPYQTNASTISVTFTNISAHADRFVRLHK